MIADKAGIRNLMGIYNSDLILSYKSRVKKYIKDNGVKGDFSDKTFGEVIDILKEGKTGRDLNKIMPTNGMETFINNDQTLYAEALNYNWEIFSKIYVDKDQLLDDKKQDEEDENKKGSKRDSLIRHLFKIQTNIFYYLNKQYNEFLRVTDYRHNICCIEDKRTLKANIESLVAVENKTIEEVIIEADEKGICLIDDYLKKFKLEKEYVYNRVQKVQFKEFQKLYDYLEGYTPFSTQHKTKGAEFNKVLVVLDNGGWRNYNFENLFLGTGTPSVLERTQKIFYVCCTRAKEELAVYYYSPNDSVIAKAKEWFGEKNVIKI
ncbi:MAG: hypothetical protein V3U80_04805 [Flavobacteriaceae bacterium]